MAVSLDTSCKTLTCAMVSSICLDEVLRGDGEGRVFNRLKGRVLQKNQENGPESILKNSKAVNLNDIKGTLIDMSVELTFTVFKKEFVEAYSM